MKTSLKTIALFVVAVALLVGSAWSPAGAQDIPLGRRTPPACAPGQFTYYNPTTGLWNCSTTGPKVPLGASDVTTASTGFAVASLNDSTSTTSGAVQNTEYTLNSVTLKASAFDANTRGIACEAWGVTAANANAKNIKMYFGATAVVTVTGSTASGKDYRGTLRVLRTGSNTQSGVGSIQVDTAVAPTMAKNASLAITDSADIVVSVKSANTAAAAASATGNGLSCTFLN